MSYVDLPLKWTVVGRCIIKWFERCTCKGVRMVGLAMGISCLTVLLQLRPELILRQWEGCEVETELGWLFKIVSD